MLAFRFYGNREIIGATHVPFIQDADLATIPAHKVVVAYRDITIIYQVSTIYASIHVIFLSMPTS